METAIGFVIGYYVGTRQGREGLQRAKESLDAIRNSPDVRQAVSVGTSMAGSAVKQVLSGRGGALITDALDAVTALTRRDERV